MAVAIQRKDLRREQVGLSFQIICHQWTHSFIFPSSVSLALEPVIMYHIYDTLSLGEGVGEKKSRVLRGAELRSRLQADEISDE